MSQPSFRHHRLLTLYDDGSGPPALPGELFAWRLDEVSGPWLLNHDSADATTPTNLWPWPEQDLITLPWDTKAGTTVTAGAAAGHRGVSGAAMRGQFASGNSYALKTGLALSAGTYTVSASVKSNNGSDQTWRFLYHDGSGYTWSGNLSVTNAGGWTRLKYTFTTSGTLDQLGWSNDGSTAGDFLADEFQLETGTTAGTYRTPDLGVTMPLGSPITRAAEGLSFPTDGTFAAGGYALNGTGAVSLSACTVMAAAKRIGTLPAPIAVPLLNSQYGGGGPSSAKVILAAVAETTGPAFSFGTTGAATANAQYADLLDGNWNVAAGTYDGTTARLFVNGYVVAEGTGTPGTQSIPYWMLANIVDACGWAGKIAYVAASNQALTPDQVRTYQARIVSQILAPRGVSLPTPRLLVVEGDSIADATLNSGAHMWKVAARNGVSPVPNMRSAAVSGSTLTDLTARAASLDAGWMPGGRNVLFVGCGVNELKFTPFASNADVDAWLAAVVTYCAARRAAGANRIYWATVLPYKGITGAADGYRTRMNTGLRAMVGTTLDGVLDFAAEATMGLVATTSDTTYYLTAADPLDGLHPTNAGQDLLGVVAAAGAVAAFA